VETLVYHAQAGTRFALVLISVFAIIPPVLAGVACTACFRRRCASVLRRLVCGWRWERDRFKSSGWWWAGIPPQRGGIAAGLIVHLC